MAKDPNDPEHWILVDFEKARIDPACDRDDTLDLTFASGQPLAVRQQQRPENRGDERPQMFLELGIPFGIDKMIKWMEQGIE
jgi:hypothetical protein